MKKLNRVSGVLKCGRDSGTDLTRAQLSDVRPFSEPDRAATFTRLWRSERITQFTKFCLVGGSGLFVDMGILYLLADPGCLRLNVTVSKIAAAEIAMINNFVWNEFWTFRKRPDSVLASGDGVR